MNGHGIGGGGATGGDAATGGGAPGNGGALRFAPDHALWVLGEPLAAAPPLVQAVQARGAVLEWAIGAGGDAVPTITLTDPAAADWLWRLVGEGAHAAMLREVHANRRAPATAEGARITPVWDGRLLADLRRLAHGHWLRVWWPASGIDAIPVLDRILLDAEIALLADELDDVLHESADAVDGPELADFMAVGRYADELRRRAGSTDAGVADLAARALELIGEPAPEPAGIYRDDYALVAGAAPDADEDAILSGTCGWAWQAVRAGVLDASESSVAWALDAVDEVELQVRVAVLAGADPAGIPVHAEVGGARATGALDGAGEAALVVDLPAADAWALEEDDVAVTLGAAAGGIDELAALRETVRGFARARLAGARDGGNGAAGDSGAADPAALAPFEVEKVVSRLV